MNPTDFPGWASELLSALGAAIGVYAGIRADLASLRVRLAHLERSVYGEPLDPDSDSPPRRRFNDPRP